MNDKLLTLAVLGALVLTCYGDDDGHHYDNPELTTDIQTKSGDYEFYYHHQNNLLLTVTRDACYYSTLDTNEQGMLKYEPQEAEAKIMRSVADGKNLQLTTLLTMRTQHQDLLANFHCVGRRIFSLDAKKAMKTGSDESDSSDSDDSD